jgi:pimeloyl-ACP methyl ester carboxylesterase
MGCAETFLPLMEELSDDIHVLALDLPGAGDSRRHPDIDPSLTATSKLLTRFIAAAGLDRPVILGHSHGGAVALRLAATNPEVLRSLILFAPAHPYFKDGDPLIRFYLTLPGRLFAYSMPWYPRWMQLMALRRMAGPKSWDTPERLRPYRANLQTPGTIAHLLKLIRTWTRDMSELRNLLRTPVATPTRIVWGEHDRAVPFHSAAELRKHLLDSELHVMPGVGHRPAEERPRLSAMLLSQWLSTPLAPTPRLYSPNMSTSHARRAAFMTSSFEAGD